MSILPILVQCDVLSTSFTTAHMSCGTRRFLFGYRSRLNHQNTHRFWSAFPLARVPFGVPIFDPRPFGDATSPAAQGDNLGKKAQ